MTIEPVLHSDRRLGIARLEVLIISQVEHQVFLLLKPAGRSLLFSPVARARAVDEDFPILS